MNEAFKLMKLDKIIRWGMILSAGLLLGQTLLLGIFYFSLPPVLPLYNQMPWGEARLGAKIEFAIPLCIIGIFFTCNYFLMGKLYSTMPLVARIVGITTLLSSVLGCIFIIRTLQITL